MKHTNDMTTGNPFSAIILFALPLIIGNVFQNLYNVVDVAIVGNSLGDHALAAVGATSALYGLYICLNFGFNNGFSLVIARNFGAKDIPRLKRSIGGTLRLGVLLSVVLTVLGIFTTRPLLVLLHTPDIDLSFRYISVLVYCVIFSVLYNTFSAILRAVGNSVAPLVFLIIGTVTNIILDVLFIRVFHMGVFGAAFATVLAQAVCALISGLYYVKKCPDLLPSAEDYKLDPVTEKELLINGLSMGMMFSIVSLGSVSLQYAINDLGDVTVTAHTAARKIDETMMLVFFPLSTAAATYSSQNLGAGKYDRIKKGILAAFAVCFAVAIIMIITAVMFGPELVQAISGTANPEVIRLGSLYLRLNVPFFFFLVCLVVLRSTLQGLGNKIVPISASFIEMGGKVIVAFFLVPVFGYMGVVFTEPAIWILGSVVVSIGFFYTMSRLRSSERG